MIRKSTIGISLLLVSIFIFGSQLTAAEAKQNLKTLKAYYTNTPPKLDGVLDDEAWKNGPNVDDVFITYNPVDENVLPQKTNVYLAYDHDNLYFAFYCFDTEPEKIKSSITRHDNVWGDDWVGLAIDTCNSQQFAYEFFCNPNGMQGDIFNSSSTGEDSTPDYIWYSSGKIVRDGYIVEIRLPLKNFRFNHGKEVEMNIMFWRRINRLGLSGSWPEIQAGQPLMASLEKVVYGQLDNQLVLELLPSVTYGSIRDRTSPDEWSDAEDNLEFGITGKYGITSSIVAEFTINPDYSQVESDEFQVLRNQRYPIFYSEKRPFFMEAGNLFNIAGASSGSSDNNLWRIFHTRRIVNPEWGVKLSGETGNLAFGALAASDKWAGRVFEGDDTNLNEGENALYFGGRAKYSLGDSNYLGAVYTSKSFAGGYNHMIGGDVKFNVGGHSLKGNFLHSFSKDWETKDKTEGSEWTMMWSYGSRGFGASLWYEHMDVDFDLETGFFRRKGIDKITTYIGPNIFPGEGLKWIHKINPYFWGYYVHDLETGEDDYFYTFCLKLFFERDAWCRFDFMGFSEYWEGMELEGNYFYTEGSAQWTNWLRNYMSLRIGDGAYYNEELSQVGDKLSFVINFKIQPDGNFTQLFGYTYEQMDSKITEDRLYDVNILYSSTRYQFNRYLFLRAVLQWDSDQELLLTDVLLSYQLNPQTVFHIGYGSLYERRSWENGEWTDPAEAAQYYQTTQSIFIKGSYQIKF